MSAMSRDPHQKSQYKDNQSQLPRKATLLHTLRQSLPSSHNTNHRFFHSLSRFVTVCPPSFQSLKVERALVQPPLASNH